MRLSPVTTAILLGGTTVIRDPGLPGLAGNRHGDGAVRQSRIQSMTDFLVNADGEKVFLQPPSGAALPEKPFVAGLRPTSVRANANIPVVVNPNRNDCNYCNLFRPGNYRLFKICPY
jgi:hypothetical protein